MRKGIAENLISWGILVVGGWWFHHANVLPDWGTIILGIGLALLATGLIAYSGRRRLDEDNGLLEDAAASPDYATVTEGRGLTRIRNSLLGGRSTYTGGEGTTEIEESDLGPRS
jgi:hypothetical protein